MNDENDEGLRHWDGQQRKTDRLREPYLRGLITKLRDEDGLDDQDILDRLRFVNLRYCEPPLSRETVFGLVYPDIAKGGRGDEHKGEAISIQASRVIPTRRDWLWEHVNVIGKETLDYGLKGSGKSTRGEDYAARVSTGRARPGEEGFDPDDKKCLITHPPASAIIMSVEDDTDDTIIPRLIAMNANLANIFIVPSMKKGDAEKGFDLGACGRGRGSGDPRDHRSR